MRVTYVCTMSAAIKYDYLRSTPKWRGQGPRYDCALINGANNIEFVKVMAYFTVEVSSTTYRVALVHRYRSVGRHASSEYIRLKDDGNMDFIFVDTIIRSVQLIPPSTYNPYFTVQDMQSPDIHLRLLSVQ
jgi:hypothetical protein